MSTPLRKTALFLRASLQLGGADRLVLTEALALINAGWHTEIWVNDFHAEIGFEEIVDRRVTIRRFPTVMPLVIAGAPRNGCRFLRQWLLVRELAKITSAPALFVVDDCEHTAWWLRQKFPETPIIYYCNFPQIPSNLPINFIHAWYREQLERLRTRALLSTQAIVANSEFARAAAQEAWPFLAKRKISVLHPGTALPPVRARETNPSEYTFVSIGRISPEKRLDLSIAALGALRGRISAEQFDTCRLIIAGGFNSRNGEQQNLFNTLRKQASELGLSGKVEFCCNLSDDALARLLAKCFALIHPMPDEHFGLAPIEAMAHGLPVLAVNNGGPTETIVDGVTGALRTFDADTFAEVLANWVQDPAKASALGAAGRERVATHFSRNKFEDQFVALAETLVSTGVNRLHRTAGPVPTELERV